MCLYPKLIKNRKYIANQKNGGIIPAVSDKRILLVPVGCGKCIECKKKKSREWQIRLSEEIRHSTNGKFVTLTFSTEELIKLSNEIKDLKGYERDNEIATLAVRRFLERWRKQYKKSVRHWLVTELGNGKTEHIHIHGIIWTNETKETINKIWKYGFTMIRDKTNGGYVNERTINYIVKYINKTDVKHKEYNPKMLTSQGIGKQYLNRIDSKNNKYKNENTNELYVNRKGYKMAIPIYYRNKIYTEEEREKLWLEKLDKNERYVCGEKINADDDKGYIKILEHYRKINKQLGYGNDEKNWNRKRYENERRNLIMLQRIKNEEIKKKKIIIPEETKQEVYIPLGDINDAW